MSRQSDKIDHLLRRKNRIRSVVSGTSVRPRLSVFISNRNVSAQLIDDDLKKTLLSATSISQKTLEKSSVTEKAIWIGQDIAKKAKAKKITNAVMDRNGKLYHGRIKALADAARSEGLEI